MRRFRLAWAAACVVSLLCVTGARAEAPALAPGATVEAGESETAATPIDLNTASASELEQLPGIGPSRAQAILAFREAHGGFTNVSQLMRIKGIGRAMLRKLRPFVTLSAANATPASTEGRNRVP